MFASQLPVTTSYKYNARGWIKEQSSGLFTQQLKYDDATGSYAQYNGNIGQQLWTTNGQSHSYNYSYDKANRLLSGISDENYNESGIQYDKMGNIQSLTRQGPTGMPGLGTLSYSYNGNQLQSVSGGYSKSYSYNSNGSVNSNGTLNIQYNELNLPKQVTGTPVGTVSYTYSAGGSKLTKQTTSETRQYIDGIEYVGTAIDLLHTEAGVARNNAGTYTYEFFLADHLGNTRIVHNSAGTVLQQQDYMPFGLDIKRYQAVPNKYKYNGKEKQEELTQYDYGARFYDPVIGRWHVVDPLADKYFSTSPYAYVLNRPTIAIDPDGKRVYFIAGAGNDKDGWDYVNRWAQTLYRSGIEGTVYRVNSSRGKVDDMDFTFNYSNEGYKRNISHYNYGAGILTPSPKYGDPIKGEFDKNEYIDQQVDIYQKHLKDNPLAKGEQMNMVGYSFGSVMSAQVALRLAEKGQVIDNLVLIGSPISDKSNLYKQIKENKNIKNVIRYDIPGDYLSNPQDIYDWIKGARQNSNDKGKHFDLARPGNEADKAIQVIIDWLRQQGVK